MSVVHSLWTALWPNMVAPSIWTILAVAWAHLRTKRHLTRQHEAIKAHIDERTSE